MSFKDDLMEDLDVFFDEDGFAEQHEINGESIWCILEGLTTKEQLTKIGRNAVDFEGINAITTILHCKASEIPEIPAKGNIITVNGEVFIVRECTNEAGLLTLTLGVDQM